MLIYYYELLGIILKLDILKSKIHRAVVTEANLNYIGSITLDPKLMDAANLREYEKVHVLNITNGNRLETYVIKGRVDSGEVCINGAAAHLVEEGDLVIIVAYCTMSNEEACAFKPSIIFVDEQNNLLK